MGSGSPRFTTPDLFATAVVREPTTNSPPSNPQTVDATPAVPRVVLPKDLPRAVKQLHDEELDRLHAAVLTEQKRRGRGLRGTNEPSQNPKIQPAPASLTVGKLNAVRAAFKAGVTPSRIARQFGVTQSDVRKALASEARKRG